MAIKFINDLSVAGTLDFSGASTQFVDGTGAFVNLSTLPQGDVTATSTTTFTNKSGSNNQWTNDAGYTGNLGTTTADNSQEFTNKTGSNNQWTNDAGYTANVGTTTASNSQTFTNKGGSNSQWTNDEGYTTASGTVTPSSTDTFTNKSGNISMWTNNSGYTTNTGTTTATNTQTFTNKSGNISQWSNNSGYTTNTGTTTASNTQTFTNKSGNISQWSNNSGYITSGSLPTVNNGVIKITATDGLSMNGVADGSAQFNLNQSDALQTLIIRNTRSGTIGGSGSTNTIPLFTAGTTLGNSVMTQANLSGNAKRVTLGARMTITGDGGDSNGGTLNLSDTTARLGICTNAYPGSITEPEASLDVGKNARIRGSLNVGSTNEQYLFVSTTGDDPVGYVKMGYYGTGTDYDLSGGAQSSTQYTTAFNNGGKICEDERIMTFKLTRSQIASLGSTQKTLIAADSNFNYIVKEAYMYQINTNPGQAPSFNSGTIVIQYQSSTGGTTRIDDAFTLSSTILNTTRSNRKVLFFNKIECAQVGTAFAVPRAAVVLKGPSVSSAGGGTVNYYLRMRVKNIDYNDDISNNSQLIVVS